MTVRQDVAVPHQTFEAAISISMAAIAFIVILIYPTLQNAINRGKQKRVMADIRTVASAVESYHEDFNAYPVGKTAVENIRKELDSYLEKELPVKDEWGNQYIYISDGVTSYTIISFGKDRAQDGPIIYQGLVTTYSNDIVFSNSSFVSFPEAIE